MDYPAIKTWADYEQYLATIKKNETGIIPGKIADSTVALFARASGYAIFDKEHGLVYGWDDAAMRIMPWEQTAEFRTVAQYLTAWAKNGYLELAGPSAGDIWSASDRIINNKISSFLFAGEYRIGETIGIVTYSLNQYMQSRHDASEIAAYRLYPDIQAQRLNPLGNGLTTGALALSAKTKDVQRVLMFLDWLQSSQKNYDLFMYGIEGKHYQLNGEQLGFPQGTTIDRNAYLGWDGRQAFKNLAFERFAAGLPVEAKESYTEQISHHTSLAPHEGFYADTAQLADLLDRRKQMIAAQIELPLLAGTFDINNLDSLIDQLRKMGTDKIIADIQAQLTAYRSR
jgi:putative aldouronate transport system substrate-binding protein